MKVTKYEHACFTVEKDSKSLVVDPGEFTTDFITPNNIAAIIITHGHADHFSLESIDSIVRANPTVTILAPADVTAQLGKYNTRTVNGGDSFAIEGFDLDFYGETHAVIHTDLPKPMNVGVLIEDRLYYPGERTLDENSRIN
jgi:L-ascorbate metabolism protein UlaG (beta-lactamase superfamily)